MKKPLTAFLFVIAVFGFAYFYIESNDGPPWIGPFTGERIAIKSIPDNRSTPPRVFADLKNPKELFLLEKGDECFVMTSPEWQWTAPKDGFTFVPIFCPRKGAGWVDHDILKM